MAKNAGNRARNGGNSKKGSSLMTGLLLGLLVGAVVAAGVVLYLNRGAYSFFGKKEASGSSAEKKAEAPIKPEVLRPAGSQGGASSGAASSSSSTAARKASGADRFDFYTVLPGLAEKGGKEPKPVAASQSAKPEPSKAAWLQIGAFQKEQDADNLKAKLALIGIEARIQTVKIPEKGTWHRVRVGPYQTAEDLDKARAQLQANGIESSVTK